MIAKKKLIYISLLTKNFNKKKSLQKSILSQVIKFDIKNRKLKVKIGQHIFFTIETFYLYGNSQNDKIILGI